MRWMGYLGLILSGIMVFCGIAALSIPVLALARAVQNYQIISNAIPINPSAMNYSMLGMEMGNIQTYLLMLGIAFLCVFLPAVLGGMYLLAYHAFNLKTSRIGISVQGIRWFFPGGELSTSWENVQGIVRQKRILPTFVDMVFLELREGVKPAGNTILRIFSNRPQKRIPIFQFVESWDSEPGKTILQHAQWIEQK
jgi:hypothetical protein